MLFVFEKDVNRNETGSVGYEFEERTLGICLILFIAFLTFMIQRLASTRFFDFDEFQVLYASASLVRGKALYSDQIGTHFPFLNILLSLLIKILGFRTLTVLAARHFILLFLFTTLFFTFKITEMIWNRAAGLLAVALTMASIVFVNKGIEIRHDTFNMTFNAIGAFWALKYLMERKIHFLWLSGLFLGLALASTQKATIWSIGIIIGLLCCTVRQSGFKGFGKVLAIYVGITMIPLLVSSCYLLLISGESMKAFLEVTLIDAVGYFSPTKGFAAYPFPYTKTYILKGLLYENGLFYVLSVCGLFLTFSNRFQHKPFKWVLASWAAVGLLFYLITLRPFHQSFLPTIPALGILVACSLTEFRDRLQFFSRRKRVFLEVLVLLCLLGWPSYQIAQKQGKSSTMTSQIQNVSFCLANLKPYDKVLCFTQQQVFFDSVLSMYGDECGKSIYEIDAKCFEREMIRQRCKVVIFDHRTRFLNRDIQKKLRNNFLPIKVGDILIPGFKIEPEEVFEKKIWIEGNYYSPTMSLEIDGEKIENNLIHLEQKEYIFNNTSTQTVFLVYIFDK